MPKLIDADKLKQHYAWWDNEDKKIFDTIIDLQPDAVRHGHWINHFDDLFPEDSSVECSVCHEYEGIMANDNYCPNCGAKMDEEEK